MSKIKDLNSLTKCNELSDDDLDKVQGGFNNIDRNYFVYGQGKQNVYKTMESNNDTNAGVTPINPGENHNVSNLVLDSWDQTTSIGKLK